MSMNGVKGLVTLPFIHSLRLKKRYEKKKEPSGSYCYRTKYDTTVAPPIPMANANISIKNALKLLSIFSPPILGAVYTFI